jgi:hypothetical protein
MAKKLKLSPEMAAELKERTERFDKRAKRRFCMRCFGRPVVERVTREHRSKLGALPPHSIFLCQGCAAGLARYVSEVSDARREAERPQREAEQARRRMALDETIAKSRARLDEQRAERGLPPLPEPGPSPGRARRPARAGPPVPMQLSRKYPGYDVNNPLFSSVQPL